MVLLIILILSEFLTFLVFRQHYKGFSRTKYYLSTVINTIVSIYMWILVIEVRSFEGSFDDPAHVWLLMNLQGIFCAVLFPRLLLDLLHFTGKIIRFKKGDHIRSLTNTGIVIWIFIFLTVIFGTLYGRFNFKTEKVTIEYQNLNKDLDGLKIVQISDLHVSGFYRHKAKLSEAMDMINKLKPDILINSGDFVSIGWREYGRSDTILSTATGRLGSFAVLGNHDIGTYYPGLNAAGIDTNIKRMCELIRASGYTLLNDEHVVIKAGEAKIGIAGIITKGRHPNMVHGDLGKAIAGMDSIDFRILISHDPNHWKKAVAGKTNIDLVFAGHTHGMQIGILTRGIKWSPSQYFYPEWNGLYVSGNQYLYTNRGLGVLEKPFRIWMPPEITVITLKRKNP
jgi:predicted MPP superfamily phosphohydrolase